MEELIVKKPLFGKEAEIVLFGIDNWLGKPLVEDAYQEGLKLHKIFDIYDKKSELSMLNKKRKLKVSKELLEVIKKAIKVSKLTYGKYDISLGKQFLERKKGKQITRVYCSYKDIKIESDMVSLLHPDVMIDLGSIAKGYITDKMIEIFVNAGVNSAMIDSRGDIRIVGDKEEIIGIQHPRDKEKNILKLKIKNISIATSGDYNQYDKKFEKSHIINQKDLVSITVAAENITEADVYATALFVLDEKERESILNNNKRIKVLTINSKLKLKYYNGFEKLVNS